MQTLSMTDLLLILFGLANAIWVGLLYLLSPDAVTGNKIFKKTGIINQMEKPENENQKTYLFRARKRPLFK